MDVFFLVPLRVLEILVITDYKAFLFPVGL